MLNNSLIELKKKTNLNIKNRKMPKKPISYENAIIYKIVCKDLDVKDLYVGSTTNFIRRRYTHKFNSINDNSTCGHYLVYDKIKQTGGWDNWQMIEICKANDCTTVEELHKKERHYMELLGANLNKFIPGRTVKEYFEDNKEKIKEQREKYEEENKEKIKLRHKEYYAKYDPELKRLRNKRYYEKHREQVIRRNAETLKERYKNDEEFREKMKMKTREKYMKMKEEQNIKEINS